MSDDNTQPTSAVTRKFGEDYDELAHLPEEMAAAILSDRLGCVVTVEDVRHVKRTGKMQLTLADSDGTVLDSIAITANEWQRCCIDPQFAQWILGQLIPGLMSQVREGDG